MSVFVALLLAQAAVPAVPAAPAAANVDCTDAKQREAFLGSQPTDDPAVAAMAARAKANGQRMEELIEKLSTSAKWTAEQKAEFEKKLLSAPEMRQPLEAGANLLDRMMAHVETIMSSKDDVKNCRAAVDMLSLLPQIDVNAQEQWAALKLLVEGEAKRLDISLD